MKTVDHQATAADMSRRVDTVAGDARRLADDLRAVLEAIDGLVDAAGRLRQRLEARQ